MNLKSKIQHIGILIFLLGVSMWGVGQPELAKAYVFVDWKFDFFKIKELSSNPEQCDNQDTCLGKCSCEFTHYFIGGTSDTYKWNAYKPHDDQLFRFSNRNPATNKTDYFEGSFKFNAQECRLIITPSPLDSGSTELYNRLVKKAVCNYQQPFCCCTTDAKSGEYSDCKRQVNYNGDSPVCQGLSSDYSYKKGSEGGQCEDFKNAFNQKIRDQKQVKETAQRGTDVKFESRKLNELPFGSPQELIGRIIVLLMSFIGSIAFGLFVYAGVLWMTARGDEGKIDQAKNIMFWATAGVAMMLASYIIVSNLFKLVSP